MRNILSGDRGMSPVVLVILIAWALLSVIFLTGTLLAARSIDRSVSGVTNRTTADGKPEKNIATTVEEIGKEGKFIDEARKTVQISTAIRKAADPLSGRLARTLEVADKGIDPKLKRILGKVGEINAVAGDINTNAKGIGTTVGSIGGSVDTIGSAVQTINGAVKSIDRRVDSVDRSAKAINGTARNILSDANGILSEVQTIDTSVARINNQAHQITEVAGTIQKDLDEVLGLVGTQDGTKTIRGFAGSIERSPLLLGGLPLSSLLKKGG